MATKLYGTIDLENRTADNAVETRAIQSPVIPPKIDSEYEDENVGFWGKLWEGTVDVLNMPVEAVKEVWSDVEAVGAGIEKFSYAALISLVVIAVVVLPKVLSVSVSNK